MQQLVAQIKWTKIHQDFTDLVFESLISYQTEPYFNSDSAMFSAVGVLKCSIYTVASILYSLQKHQLKTQSEREIIWVIIK